ncbi:hypothetical protein C8Q80DRAFT_1124752 [Daedaleopsis nitida]|nr:hypothetical protein C8Q80DRAFT_1124752 [Daedaleopsis nitida]
MSDVAVIVVELQISQIVNYCFISVYAFLLHEHVITLGQEVELFWRRKVNGATILFLANRFLVLAFFTLSMVSYLGMSDESCVMFAKGINVINILVYLPWAVFSALRAFALSQSWPLAVTVLLLSSVTIGMLLSYYHFGLTGYNDPLTGLCRAVLLHITPKVVNDYAIITPTCQIAADVVLIIITWRATHSSARIKNMLRRSLSLSEVLLRDGLIYFVRFIQLQYGTYFSTLVTTVIHSRFLIDLQTAADTYDDTQGTSVDSTLAFASVRSSGAIIGSIGSSIYTDLCSGSGALDSKPVEQGESSLRECESMSTGMQLRADIGPAV